MLHASQFAIVAAWLSVLVVRGPCVVRIVTFRARYFDKVLAISAVMGAAMIGYQIRWALYPYTLANISAEEAVFMSGLNMLIALCGIATTLHHLWGPKP